MTNSCIQVDSGSESDSDLMKGPFCTASSSPEECTSSSLGEGTSSTAEEVANMTSEMKNFSTLKELMHWHKMSLKLEEDNRKRIRVSRDDLWHESVAIFKKPSFDPTAAPYVRFEGEAGVDAGGLSNEYGSLLCQEIFSSQAHLFEGEEHRKLPIYSIDAMNSRLFQLAGKMVAYLILHLDIGIPCLSPAVYNYIVTSTASPESCSIEDVVDLELREMIVQVVWHCYEINLPLKSST